MYILAVPGDPYNPLAFGVVVARDVVGVVVVVVVVDVFVLLDVVGFGVCFQSSSSSLSSSFHPSSSS